VSFYGRNEPTGDEPIYRAHDTFRRWLGPTYDMYALDAVLSCAAVDQLSGDPAWLLVVGGSGNAKTETVGALAGVGAVVTSTIASEGALLSATGVKERAKDATGGLLRRVGERGLIVVKDFTSIISMNRDMRAQVLAALREVYDGKWERNVGTDGGRSLTWTGRIVLIGAVTTAYDTAHSVIAAMGDRFALIRLDSITGRQQAGRQALSNVGSEVQMRRELAEAGRLVLTSIDHDRAVLDDKTEVYLLGLADVVTWARTAVERDNQGEVIDAHAPEMPTRLAKMLGQIVRGGLAIGLDHDRAVSVATRIARDSMPPLRRMIIGDLLDHPYSTIKDIQLRVHRPYATVRREVQALYALELLDEMQEEPGDRYRYALSSSLDLEAVRALVSRNVSTGTQGTGNKGVRPPTATDIPGNGALWPEGDRP
jgi:hypothetical protein